MPQHCKFIIVNIKRTLYFVFLLILFNIFMININNYNSLLVKKHHDFKA